MHPLNGALPGLYVPVRVTRGTLVAHRYTYAPNRCRTSQPRRTFISLSVSLDNDLANPVFYAVVLAGFKSWANAFLVPKLLDTNNCLLVFFHLTYFCLYVGTVWLGSSDGYGVYHSLSALLCRPFLIIIIIIIIII